MPYIYIDVICAICKYTHTVHSSVSSYCKTDSEFVARLESGTSRLTLPFLSVKNGGHTAFESGHAQEKSGVWI